MTKYDGVRKVDTVLNESVSVEKKKRPHGDFLLRLVAAALIAAVPFGLKAIGGKYADKAVEFVKTAVTYDVLTGEEIGETEIAFVEKIKEYVADGEEE